MAFLPFFLLAKILKEYQDQMLVKIREIVIWVYQCSECTWLPSNVLIVHILQPNNCTFWPLFYRNICTQTQSKGFYYSVVHNGRKIETTCRSICTEVESSQRLYFEKKERNEERDMVDSIMSIMYGSQLRSVSKNEGLLWLRPSAVLSLCAPPSVDLVQGHTHSLE